MILDADDAILRLPSESVTADDAIAHFLAFNRLGNHDPHLRNHHRKPI